MDRLEAMTILVSAVDTGSLSAASRRLRIPLATVSRRVSELEAHLNVRLLHRGRRSLVLTEAGRNYVASCRRLMDEIAEVERIASGEYFAPQGELTISASAGIGRIHLLPIVDDFLGTFPEIRVRLQLTDRYVHFADDRVDLALRIGKLADSSSVVAARVGAVRLNFCASPAYLQRRGLPRRPAELATHDCLVHETHAASHHWPFYTEGVMQMIEVPYRLSLSMGDATVAAAVAGAGIARGLSHLTDDLVRSGALVRVLEAYEPPPLVVSLIYPSQRQPTLKLRAFLDFAIPRLRNRLGGAGRSGS